MIGERLLTANHKADRIWRERGMLHIPGVYRKTRKFCSDPYCCGNPRRMKGRIKRTKQEKIADVNLREGLEQVYGG
jgi:hypothetical protein